MALDIQGAELLALEGAEEILTKIDYIYLEVNTKELYENGAKLEDVEHYLDKFNFKRQTMYMTPHGWGDAFYVRTTFNISTNFKIEYGIDKLKTNITDALLKKSTDLGVLYIPNGDDNRSALFGDPLYGTLKSIFITSDNDTFIISKNDYAYVDTAHNKLYINEMPAVR